MRRFFGKFMFNDDECLSMHALHAISSIDFPMFKVMVSTIRLISRPMSIFGIKMPNTKLIEKVTNKDAHPIAVFKVKQYGYHLLPQLFTNITI